MPFCPQFSPKNTENRILGLLKCHNFLGKHAPRPPPLEKGEEEWSDLILVCMVPWRLDKK